MIEVDLTERAEKVIDYLKTNYKQTVYKLVPTENSDGIFASKFGGLPYWDNKLEYPTDANGKKMVMLAQLNFDKLGIDDKLLPKTGMLQFFITPYDDLYGLDFDNPTAQTGFRVVYHKNVDYGITEEAIKSLGIKSNTELVGSDESDEVILPSDIEIAVKAEKSEQAICNCVAGFDEIYKKAVTAMLGNETLTDAEENAVYSDDALFEFGHKMLGFPAFTQYDPREADDEHNILLLQMDSTGEYEMMWGDSGVGAFFINEEKLKNLDFSDVLYNWDCY